jgi:hypothetical protein
VLGRARIHPDIVSGTAALISSVMSFCSKMLEEMPKDAGDKHGGSC